MTSFTAKDVPDQTGKTIFITGANTGLGYEAAKTLAGGGSYTALEGADRPRNVVIEFPSMEAALAWQAQATPPLAFRIGIHLGDVLDYGASVKGDSVNIAARIQEMAGPRQILIGDEIGQQGDTLALEAIANVGPGGNFLSQKHTRKHMRHAMQRSIAQQLDPFRFAAC